MDKLDFPLATPKKNKTQTHPLSTLSIAGHGIRLYFRHFLLFTGIVFIGQFFDLIDFAMEIAPFPVSPYWGYLLKGLGVCFSSWGAMALIRAAWHRLQDKKTSVFGSYAGFSPATWSQFVILSLLYFVMVCLGFVMFLVPGIYMGTVFVMAGYLLVLEELSIFESLKRSRKLIAGRFWTVLGVELICLSYFMILMFSFVYFSLMDRSLGLAVFNFGVIFILALFYVTNVVLFERLKLAEVSSDAEGDVLL